MSCGPSSELPSPARNPADALGPCLRDGPTTPGMLIYLDLPDKGTGTELPLDRHDRSVRCQSLCARGTNRHHGPSDRRNDLAPGRPGQGTSVIPWFESEGLSPEKSRHLQFLRGQCAEASCRQDRHSPLNRLLMQHLLKTIGAPPDAVREVMHLPRFLPRDSGWPPTPRPTRLSSPA